MVFQNLPQQSLGYIPFPVARLIFSRHTALNQGAEVFATFFWIYPNHYGQLCRGGLRARTRHMIRVETGPQVNRRLE
jgi:hypothetical protein